LIEGRVFGLFDAFDSEFFDQFGGHAQDVGRDVIQLNLVE
jgi:hypothetical protein